MKPATKTVCIDAMNIALAKGSGIATYGRNLLANLNAMDVRTQILYGPTAAISKRPILNEIALTDAQVEAILTDDQKKALPAFLKDVQAFQSAQLPLALISDLKLTDDQKTKMAAVVTQIQKIAQEKRQEAMDNQDFQSLREIMTQTQTALKDKTRALLTVDQKAMVEKYEKENPNQGFGARGGRGGGQGGPGGAGQGGNGAGRGGRGGNGGGNPPPTQNGNGAPPPRF